MASGQPRTSTSRRRAPTSWSVLDALSAGERSVVLGVELEAHPELVGEAEAEAHRLLSATTVDDVAADVSSALRMIPLEELGARAGRVRGRGYVHEADAAWEIVEEAVEPFLADMRRRASLGLAGSAAVVATAVVAGLYMVDPPDEGSVLACAGLDVPGELADAVLDEAVRLGLDIDPDAPGQYWPRWDRLGLNGWRRVVHHATVLGRWRGDRKHATAELRGAGPDGRRAAGG